MFDHQIPGGQYSNLMVQCKSMGLWSQWDTILDTYRDVNRMFGDIIKVTPSSKVVGDMVSNTCDVYALFYNNLLHCQTRACVCRHCT